MKTPTLKEFIGKASYNPESQQIFGIGFNEQLLCDIRGWGAIQYMFKTHEDGMRFQDTIGQFIADAINEKIERLKGETLTK